MQTPASGVLVTGATGFIGQHIVSSLLANGQTVTALIRPEKSTDARLPSACIQVPAAITDIEKLEQLVESCSAVIYCAGSVRGGQFEDFQAANVDGLQALLHALDKAANCPPLLLVSSLAASRPELSDYSKSKFRGEQCLINASELPWTIIRPPAIYGPGDKEMLPIFKLAAKGWVLRLGPPNQRVSLLQVEDLARAVVAWLAKPESCLHQTYAIDDGAIDGYDWPAIAEAAGATRLRTLRLPSWLLTIGAQINLKFARVFGYAPMFTPGKVRELTQEQWLSEDNVSFETATGWRPTMDLKAGLKDLLPAKSD